MRKKDYDKIDALGIDILDYNTIVIAAEHPYSIARKQIGLNAVQLQSVIDYVEGRGPKPDFPIPVNVPVTTLQIKCGGRLEGMLLNCKIGN